MRKDRIKKFVPVTIVILFLGLAISPSINAVEPRVMPKTVRIWMPGITEDDYKVEIEVTEEQLNEINNTIQDVSASLEEALKDNSPKGKNVTAEEWEIIKAKAFVVIDLLYQVIGDDFPYAQAKQTIINVISSFIGPLWWLLQPIFSVGLGFVVIPFYEYETFIGKMLRPVWIWYMLGYSISIRPNPFPPIIPYGKLGYHRIRSLFYTGLFIDFGKLGFDRRLGPKLLIGYGFNGMAG